MQWAPCNGLHVAGIDFVPLAAIHLHVIPLQGKTIKNIHVAIDCPIFMLFRQIEKG